LLYFILCSNTYCQEEFNGPFKSWANVKTRFGAKGDGKTDDTRALQMALDSLSDRPISYNIGARGYAVVYIPAGTYIITNTLVLRGKIGVQIVGADPKTTILQWKGPENDTLFWANGSAYFYFGRLTLDPGDRKNMEAIGLHWLSVWRSSQNNSSAPLNIEFSDLIFRSGFATGISGGTQDEGTNSNDSEIVINRCIFNKCSRAGIKIRGYNALDYWIWYCRFIQCSAGVECNSGNYHIYYSYFKQSTTADVMNTNCYYSSVRFCYSVGSAIFSFDNGKSSNPFKRIFQENSIIDPKQIPIQYYHAGKITLIDNYCKVPINSQVKAFLTYDTWAKTNYEVLEVGNVFENFKNIYHFPVSTYKIYRGRITRRALPSEKMFLQRLPACPQRVNRTVYDIPSGATSANIQLIINKATALKKRAIVHFPFGLYYLEIPLILEKNCDIQITGDALLYASSIILHKNPAVFENGSVFKIFGPSTVSIRDLHMQTKAGHVDYSRAIVIFNADQPSSTLLIDQLYAGADSSIVVNGYDNLRIQKTNSFFSAGNYLVGGKASLKGTSQLRMQCFGAQFAKTIVKNNANFLAADCWWEGNSRVPLDITGEGTILLQGAMVAPNQADSNTTIRVNKFKGKIGLLDMYILGGLEVKRENPDLKLLVWNINFYHKRKPLLYLNNNGNYQAFFGGITAQCFEQGDPVCENFLHTEDIEINIKDIPQFLEEFIGLIRSAKPLQYIAKPAGVSTIRISRVSISEKFSAALVMEKRL